ncbi:MAG: dihydrolipoamide acetyltransferase family protein [Pseudomonadota bacterium]
MSKLRAFTMPKWGIEMSEGTIAEWMVAEGGAFAKGDILTLIETDKITNEVEAEFEGSLARVLVGPGNTVPVGALLAVFATGDADAAEVDAFIAGFVPADTRMASAAGAPAPSAPAPVAAVASTIADDLAISPAARRHAEAQGIAVDGIAGRGRDGRITLQDVMLAERPIAFAPADGAVSIEPLGQSLGQAFASPLAKRLAVLHGVDIGAVQGSGPRGRVSKADILKTIPAPVAKQPEPIAATPAAPYQAMTDDGPFEATRMSGMRKAIARQLTYSKQTVPHFYLRFSAQLDAVLHLRQMAKQATGSAPSINDYLVRAAALALIEHPDVNIQVEGDEIRRFAQANISIAVETPKGLVTPVIRGAEGKTVAQISSEIKALAERARAGKLQADEMRGGGFSVSNLGMFGVESFDAIINPPQGAILAVGAGIRRPIDANHAVAFATMVSLSISFDHRAIDGAVGARFGQTLKALIEEPARLTA